jgi:hypothetical protein
MVMELFFLGVLVGALFMYVWGCLLMVFPREQLVVHHIDIAESNRQASAAYQQKRIEDHAYMMAALKDD